MLGDGRLIKRRIVDGRGTILDLFLVKFFSFSFVLRVNCFSHPAVG